MLHNIFLNGFNRTKIVPTVFRHGFETVSIISKNKNDGLMK